MNEPVDVVIVTYNSAAHLEACVAAVRAWVASGRVIVVDNASGDESAAIAQRVADEVVVAPVNCGYGAGQNLGAARVQTEFFVALNPDARLHGDAIDHGVRLLRERPRAAAVQGVIRRASDHGVERSFGREPGIADLVAHRFHLRQRLGERALKRLAPLVGADYFTHRTPVEAVSATSFLAFVAPLVRTAAFRSVDGFDEEYFLYAEDVDLCHRLRLAGWGLLATQAEWAEHVGGASTAGRTDVKDAEWWRGHRRLVRQHWTGPRRAVGLVLVAGRG
ncbi:MAG TPA: glycosyltransferase [Acidimicrobiales bacterium]|nr:glycosyltransferase [Acidimicrobiales bacterium]